MGSDGLYSVSDLGGVRNETKGTPVKPFWTGDYFAFTIHKARTRRTVRLHIAVAEAFLGPRPDGMVCAHLDGNAENCSLTNLAWVTPEENEAHKRLHGTAQTGTRHHAAKFTRAEIEVIRKARRAGLTLIDIATLAKVAPSTIADIVNQLSYASE